MADSVLPATLGFLTDAAHLLVSASPETSAHLMSQRDSLMFHHDLDRSGVQRQHVCGCCGHIMIVGRGHLLKLDSIKTGRRKRRSPDSKTSAKASASAPGGGCRKVLTCGKCSRYTTIQLPQPARMPKRRFKQNSKTISNSKATESIAAAPAKTVQAPIGITAPPAASVKPSANASSKQRAKNRKQGLQALLQQQSSSKSQVGLGLSLADFLQN